MLNWPWEKSMIVYTRSYAHARFDEIVLCVGLFVCKGMHFASCLGQCAVIFFVSKLMYNLWCIHFVSSMFDCKYMYPWLHPGLDLCVATLIFPMTLESERCAAALMLRLACDVNHYLTLLQHLCFDWPWISMVCCRTYVWIDLACQTPSNFAAALLFQVSLDFNDMSQDCMLQLSFHLRRYLTLLQHFRFDRPWNPLVYCSIDFWIDLWCKNTNIWLQPKGKWYLILHHRQAKRGSNLGRLIGQLVHAWVYVCMGICSHVMVWECARMWM